MEGNENDFERKNMLQEGSPVTPLQQIISSCTGSFITSLFVTPLDVVKVRLQSQQKHLLKNRCFLYCNGFIEDLCCALHSTGNHSFSSPYWYHGNAMHFNGTVDAFVKITRTEGIKSLWSGLPATLMMAVPATVIYFTVYDQFRNKMTKACNVVHPPLWVPVIAGGSARVVSCTVISPLEMVRTKMQSERLGYIEIKNALKNLVQSQGLFSLWRGLGPTFLRDVPFSAFYWTFYELLKTTFQQQTPTFWFSFTAGGAAGSVAAALTVPFDVIKTHRQIELGEMHAIGRKVKPSTYSLMKNLYQQSGYRALFTGIVPRVVKISPACAIMISTYEHGKKFFQKRNASNATAV